MNNKYILSLDQGTTSSRAILFDNKGDIASMAQKEFEQIFPQPGWVEHDPVEIWSTQFSVASEVIAKLGIKPTQIAAIGIANQRETTIVWNKKTGEPIYNAIVWQDHRTSDICNKLITKGLGEKIKSKTGLEIDAYFSATKISWILDNVKGARSMAKKGELAFGTVDSWLIWNLTDGKEHITDITNASRTLLFNIHTQEWDKELLEIFNVPDSMLPEVYANDEIIALTSGKLISTKIPISGVLGDQQAAMFGQLCIEKGMVKNTYGTGCFLMLNTGKTPVESNNKLITTIAWKINDEVTYALEGSVFVAGAVVQWLRDKLGIIKDSADVEAIASKVKNTGGVYFVPAFTGLGAPYWEQNAMGMIHGITRGTDHRHIARAALESIAFQSYDVIKAMEKDIGTSIKNIRADGGASANNLLMQFQSDILQTKLERPDILETTALGAAYMAGLNVGYWGSISELKSQWKLDKRFKPKKSSTEIVVLINGWKDAVNRVINETATIND